MDQSWSGATTRVINPCKAKHYGYSMFGRALRHAAYLAGVSLCHYIINTCDRIGPCVVVTPVLAVRVLVYQNSVSD